MSQLCHQNLKIVTNITIALISIESIVVQTWFSFASKEKWFYEYQPYKILFIHLNFRKKDCLADEVCVGGEQRGFGRPGWICSSILSRLIVANLSGFIAPPCGCLPVCLRNAFESNAVACWFKWWCVELIFGFSLTGNNGSKVLKYPEIGDKDVVDNVMLVPTLC